MKRKIITLTGHKHTKKTIVAEKLAKNSEVEYVKQYTDAKEPFDNNGNPIGWGYHYVSKEELDYLLKNEEVLHNTTVNGHRYCLFKSQIKAPYSVVIANDYGVVDIRTNWSEDIFTIRLVSDNEEDSDNGVGEYLYKHEFDLVFDVDHDDFDEMEALIV